MSERKQGVRGWGISEKGGGAKRVQGKSEGGKWLEERVGGVEVKKETKKGSRIV